LNGYATELFKKPTMDHIAIMKKEWGLIPKILNGQKTIESRWYKTKIAPWDKIHKGDLIYFKDSGSPVTARAKVTTVAQYTINDNDEALEIMIKNAEADLGTRTIPSSVKDYIMNKNYAIFVSFDSVEPIKPFDINKEGFGMQCAWISVENIESVKVL
jgi:ASC-1-like (ASCH) protein